MDLPGPQPGENALPVAGAPKAGNASDAMPWLEWAVHLKGGRQARVLMPSGFRQEDFVKLQVFCEKRLEKMAAAA